MDNLAKQARDQERRRKFVLIKTKEGNEVPDVRQYARHRARIEADIHDLQEIIECMNMKQKGLFGHLGAKINIGEWSPGGSSGKVFSGSRGFFGTTGSRWRKLSFSTQGGNGGAPEGKKEDKSRGVEDLGGCKK